MSFELTARALPHVFWLCGLSGAGKSTLATLLAQVLRSQHYPLLELDSDHLRAGLCRGLGYSIADRNENLRRAAETARLALDSGLGVIAAFITPLQSQRELVRQIVGPNLSLIFVDSDLATCRQRDVKGLYAQAADGRLPLMTGLDSRFERPTRPDLILPTGAESVGQSRDRLQCFANRILHPENSSSSKKAADSRPMCPQESRNPF